MAFVLQTLMVVIAVFGLMYSAGTDVMEDASIQYRSQLGARIRHKISSYLSEPEAIIELDTDLFDRGLLRLDDPQGATRLFWKQMMVHPSVAAISVGTREGRFFGVRRMADGTLQQQISGPETGGALHSWVFDDGGMPLRKVDSRADHDPRRQAWYQAGTRLEGMAWSEISSRDATPHSLVVGPMNSIAHRGEMMGVLTVEISLVALNTDLRDLDLGHGGMALVVDGEGALVGTSTDQSTTGDLGDQRKRVSGLARTDTRIRDSLDLLTAEVGASRNLVRGRHLGTDPKGNLVTALPLRHGHKLDWSVIVSIPRDQFVGTSVEIIDQTVLLCLLALGLALLFATGVSRSITEPLSNMTEWVQRIRTGDPEVVADLGGGEVEYLTDTMKGMIDDLREQDIIHHAFGRYLSPEVAAQFMGNPQALQLGGQRRVVTILMSDLRGFTALSGRLPPEDMVRLLNRYLGRMTDVIVAHRGTIIEFIGDAILVLFGAPIQGPDDPDRAVRCAIAMQQAMVALDIEMVNDGLPTLEMGIAINTGEVVAGNIGSERHVKYGVVGEPVNLTARLESLAFGNEVLLSAATYRLVADTVDVEPARTVRVKGIADSLTIHGLLGMRDEPENRLLGCDGDPLVETDLTAELYRIDEYLVDETAVSARVVRLGEHRLDVVCDTRLVPSDKYELRIRLPGDHWTTNTYAGVTHEPTRPTEARPEHVPVRLGFTSIEHGDRAAISSLREQLTDDRDSLWDPA